MGDRYLGKADGRAKFKSERWWWDDGLQAPTNLFELNERETLERRALAERMGRGTEPYDQALADFATPPALETMRANGAAVPVG